MFNLESRYERTSDDPDAVDQFAEAKVATARWVGECLNRHYPGYPWFVKVEGDRLGAVIAIQIKGLMPDNRWYAINFRDAVSDPSGKLVVMGAGELLERYNIPRTGFTAANWFDALQRFPLGNGRGHLEPLR